MFGGGLQLPQPRYCVGEQNSLACTGFAVQQEYSGAWRRIYPLSERTVEEPFTSAGLGGFQMANVSSLRVNGSQLLKRLPPLVFSILASWIYPVLEPLFKA